MSNGLLRVGFGRTVITPNEPVPLGGYGHSSKRFNQVVRDDLHATCVAVSDAAGSTVLFLEMDGLVVDEPFLSDARERIKTYLGIPPERVMIGASHSHSTPDNWNFSEPSIQRNHKFLAGRLYEAAALALQDMAEAVLSYGSIKVDNMNFVKHYCHTTPEGQTLYFGDNFGTAVYDETTRHATDANPMLHVLRFAREGKKDIVIGNWRAHPHFTSGLKKYEMSGDYIGVFYRTLERMRDCHAMFIQGCAGNLNSSTRLPEERRYTSCDSYGIALAANAVECLDKYMTEAAPGEVKSVQVMLNGKLDHRQDHLVEYAEVAQKIWLDTADSAKVREYGLQYGIRSPYHAGNIIKKASRGKTHEMELNAICLGPDVAIVTGSEMFDTISTATEADSPFATTITMGYCGAYRGYMPSKFGFEYTCYESDVAWYAPGIAEQIVENYLEMLHKLKEK